MRELTLAISGGGGAYCIPYRWLMLMACQYRSRGGESLTPCIVACCSPMTSLLDRSMMRRSSITYGDNDGKEERSGGCSAAWVSVTSSCLIMTSAPLQSTHLWNASSLLTIFNNHLKLLCHKWQRNCEVRWDHHFPPLFVYPVLTCE